MEKHLDKATDEGIMRASGDVTPVNAGDVIAHVIDIFREKNIPVASRHIGMLSKQVKELLDDGYDWRTLVVASKLALQRGAPGHMHYIANDLVMARAGERMTRREYETALQDEMEIGGRQ